MKHLVLALCSRLPPCARRRAAAAGRSAEHHLSHTKDGRITIRLRPDLAPKHVEQIKALTKRGFYNGVVFHRVIRASWPRPATQPAPAPANRTCRTCRPNSRRSLSSAAPSGWRARRTRTPPIPSSSSARGLRILNGQYTIVGKVVYGMDLADKIKKGDQARTAW